jgi:hypothetical protein
MKSLLSAILDSISKHPKVVLAIFVAIAILIIWSALA